MSHYPCLEKDYIHGVLNPYESQMPDNWRDHLNSQILDKYLEIKRNQKQKIAQILPRYHIFPKNFNTYNIYTNQYDLNRIQRIKNSSNAKYAQTHKSKQKNSNSQQRDDLVFIKSGSKVINGANKFHRPRGQQENRSEIKLHQTKSTKSLTQTQLSPSKFSKNFNQRNPSKNAIDSDSQLSGQRPKFFREKRKECDNKSWTSNARSHTNGKGYKNDQRMFSNIESAITVVKREKNGRRNQGNDDYYYGPERGSNVGGYKRGMDEREISTRKSGRSPKNLLYYHSQNEYEIGRNTKRQQDEKNQIYDKLEGNNQGQNIKKSRYPEEGYRRRQTDLNQDQQEDKSNCYIESPFNPRYQQSQMELNKMKHKVPDQKQSRISGSKEKYSFESKIKGKQSEIRRNEAIQGSSNSKRKHQEQRSVHGQPSNIHGDSSDQNHGNQTKKQRAFNQKHNSKEYHIQEKDQTKQPNSVNRFPKNQTIDNQTQVSNIQDKLLQYYGDEFDRVKAERDYLRKHFIEHLEQNHSDKLPYKQLTEIKVDETGKKLIISQRSVPISKNEKDNQVFYAQRVEYSQRKNKK